jgi:hypothetical protein
VIGRRCQGAGSHLAVTVFMIFGSFTAAAAYAATTPHSVGALSLELDLRLPRTITQPIKRLLNINSNETHQQNPSGQAVSRPNETTLVETTPDPQPSTTSSEVQSSPPDADPLPKMPQLYVDIGVPRFIDEREEPVDNQAVLGSSATSPPIESMAVLQKSEQGWVLLGVPWYVWITGTALVAVVLKLGYRQLASVYAGISRSKATVGRK